MLEDLCELLAETAPRGQFLWNNQQVVHVCREGGGEPWATIHTKRQAGLDVTLAGPKGRFAPGRIARLAGEPELQTDRPDKDLVKLRFVDASEVAAPEFAEFFANIMPPLARGRSRRCKSPLPRAADIISFRYALSCTRIAVTAQGILSRKAIAAFPRLVPLLAAPG